MATKTNPPKFHGRGSNRTTEDGRFMATKYPDGLWILEECEGYRNYAILEDTNYKELLRKFAEWWKEHGEDKREKEMMRF